MPELTGRLALAPQIGMAVLPEGVTDRTLAYKADSLPIPPGVSTGLRRVTFNLVTGCDGKTIATNVRLIKA